VQALFWLAMARVAGLMLAAPPFSLAALPPRYRVLLALGLSAALLPAAAASALPAAPSALLAAALGELAIGMAIGLLARCMLAAFQLAGTAAGLQMGLSMASVIDPSGDDEVPLLGTLQYTLAAVAFLVLDGHHVLIRALSASYEAFPVGAALRSDVLAQAVSDMGGALWETGVRAAAPLTGIMLLINGVMGFLNRASPQISIFNVGFPLSIAAGLVAALLATPASVDALLRALDDLASAAAALLGG
jgi:flagellar biosynthetic protein FliR